jgi:hypothetical protein
MTAPARMSIEAAVSALAAHGKNLAGRDLDFARDLYKAAKHPTRDLSEKQAYWIAELAHKAMNPNAANENKRESKSVNATAINAMFDNARSNGHKSPKVYFTDDSVGEIRLTVSKGGQYPGTIQIADRQGNWYGRIMKDGEVHCKRGSDNVIAAVSTFVSDPHAAVVKYGRKTGNCSFCARELTDAESVKRGYGPVCADNYGLPYGN